MDILEKQKMINEIREQALWAVCTAYSELERKAYRCNNGTPGTGQTEGICSAYGSCSSKIDCYMRGRYWDSLEPLVRSELLKKIPDVVKGHLTFDRSKGYIKFGEDGTVTFVEPVDIVEVKKEIINKLAEVTEEAAINLVFYPLPEYKPALTSMDLAIMWYYKKVGF